MRASSIRTTIKRIIALGVGLSFLLFTNDIGWIICGGFLLLWAIVNILGDKFYTFEIISNIIDIIAGLCLIVFGIIITISDSYWALLVASAFGLLILLQGLLPIIAKIQSKRNHSRCQKADIKAKE